MFSNSDFQIQFFLGLQTDTADISNTCYTSYKLFRDTVDQWDTIKAKVEADIQEQVDAGLSFTKAGVYAKMGKQYVNQFITALQIYE